MAKQSWWRRLVDGLDPSLPEDAQAPPSEREPALEAEIERDPESIDPYLVYADWLADRSDPRGELIALQAKCTAEPDETRWDPSVRTLDPWTTLVGDHAPAARALIERFPNRLGGELRGGDHAEWHCGYWRRLHVLLERDSPFKIETQLRDALRQDSARFLRTLSIEPTDILSIPERLPELPSTLRALHLGALAVHPASLPPLREIEPLWPRINKIETIVLQGQSLQLRRPFEAPMLRSLELITDAVDPQTLHSLAGSTLPTLDTLIVWLGGTPWREAQQQDVVRLLAAPRPTLRHFGLVRCRFIDELIERIADAPWAAGLRVLDLSRGGFSAIGVSILARVRDRFPELRYLDLSDCPMLGPEARRRARTLAPEVRLTE